MFANYSNVSASYRVIATLVATALIMWATGVYNYAQAANITTVSDTLSDSDRGVDSNHTITFTAPTAIGIGKTIVYTFPVGFVLTGVTTGDFAMTVPDANWTEAINTVARTITLTRTTATTTANATTTLLINGANKINNATTTGSYQIDIAGTMTDSGHTRVAILDNVDVTAKVNTSFNFTVIGRATSTAVNGVTTTRTSSSTTIPFGTLVAGPGGAQVLAQNLTVQTNAIHGFVVTVKESQNLLSSTGADIDNFKDSVTSATPVAWTSPTNLIANENTWGHWGVTSQDYSTTRSVQFASNIWAGVSTTPQVLFSHTGPADGTTASIGSTTVGYKVEISALQEAGDDYSTVLTYVATPTF